MDVPQPEPMHDQIFRICLKEDPELIRFSVAFGCHVKSVFFGVSSRFSTDLYQLGGVHAY